MKPYEPVFDSCVYESNGWYVIEVWNLRKRTLVCSTQYEATMYSERQIRFHADQLVAANERGEFAKYRNQHIQEALCAERAKLKNLTKRRRKLLMQNREKSLRAKIARELKCASQRARAVVSQE